MLEKWKKAVVHLESVTDSKRQEDQKTTVNDLFRRVEDGEMTIEQMGQELLEGTRDVRFHGTSLFVHHAGRRYLLTARHNVLDDVEADRRIDEWRKVTANAEPEARELLRQQESAIAEQSIFSLIFRVPSPDEVKRPDGRLLPEFLMNLGAGGGAMTYSFSEPELDLAVISLDQRSSGFADQLVELGYCPIDSDDIEEQPAGEGSEVFTVGYPRSVALLGVTPQSDSQSRWSSLDYSLPVFAFGRVSMMHEDLTYFWSDMSIFPGNSGGPVIEKGKLVGVVSKQAVEEIEDVDKGESDPNMVFRIPFGKIVKSKYVLEILDIQHRKDIAHEKGAR